jgi:hypothetical protein
LERRQAHFILRDRRVEVEERPDVSTHFVRTLSAASPAPRHPPPPAR